MAAERTDSYFDAAAIAAVQLAPKIEIGHLMYRGRLLSIEEWLPWWEEWQALDESRRALTPADQQIDPTAALHALQARADFARRYFRVVFPRRRFPSWAPDPVAHLMAKPYQMIEEALQFFFILQARATFGADVIDAVMPPLPPEVTTVGSSSPDRTAAVHAAVEA